MLALFGCQPKEITSAKIYIQRDDWQQAQTYLEAAVAQNPGNAEAHFLLGRAYAHHGRFRDMNKEFEQSLQLSDKFQHEINAERERYWISKFNAGITALDLGRTDMAEAALKSAIAIDPIRYEAYKKLGVTYLTKNEPRKAILLYEKLLESLPENLDLLSSAANLYYSQNQFAKVIPILLRILAMDPSHRDALANLALSYDALDETEKAEKAYIAAIQANTIDKDLIFLFAAHHYRRGQFRKSIQLFEQVLVLSPNDFEATSNIGNAYLSMAEAIKKQLKDSVTGSVSAQDVHDLKSKAVLNYKTAIPYLEKSLEMQSDHPALWRNLGVVYINTGKREKGEQAFLRAEELQVQSVE